MTLAGNTVVSKMAEGASNPRSKSAGRDGLPPTAVLQNQRKIGMEVKFLVTANVHPEELHEGLGVFVGMTPEEDQAAMGEDLKLIGRWHDLLGGRGVAIFETRRAQAISRWWNRKAGPHTLAARIASYLEATP